MSPRILYCHCANAQLLLPATREAALGALCESGLPFEAVADLCECSAHRDPLLSRLAAEGPVIIAACHPRTVRCLFAAADVALPASTQYLNLRTESPETVCTSLQQIPREAPATPQRNLETVRTRLEATSGGWNPWAPVIDYDRCTGCMQCLSFCLFGVYAVDAESHIEVRNPEQCKTNCPACSRVCPEAAILFPKHPSEAINGGSTAEGSHETMKVDLSALFGGGDLAAILRERNQRTQPRFSKDRDPAQALAERRKYLTALGEIPPEVFHHLPSPEEIARRVAEAQANAQAALKTKSELRDSVSPISN